MSTKVETLTVELTLDDGKYTARIKGAGKAARAFSRQIDQINKSVQRSERRMRGFTATLRDWTLIIGQARNALNQIAFLTTDWMGAIVRTNAEIERMTFLLKGMSKETTELGRATDAADTLDELFSLAKTSPFSINAMTDSLVKMKSVGIEPLDGELQSLVDAVAAFGGTDETLGRASIAIQQMAGKGVISMEELRQQLGEAVPQAITIMARELGATYGELVDQISKGNVEARRALEAMFRGFGIDFAGRAESLMEGFNGQVARLKTNWTELISSNAGMIAFFEEVTRVVRDMNDALESGRFDEFFTNLGNGLKSVTSLAWSFASGVMDLVGTLQALYGMWQNPPPLGGTFSNFINWATSAQTKISNLLSQMDEAMGWEYHPDLNPWIYGPLGIRRTGGGLLGQIFGDVDQEVGTNLDRFINFVKDTFNDAEIEVIGEKMRQGIFVDESKIEEAVAAFQRYGKEVQETSFQIQDLSGKIEGLENFDPSILTGSLSGLDDEVLQQIDLFFERGQPNIAAISGEIEGLREKLASLEPAFDAMDSSLQDIEQRAAQSAFDDWIDENSVQGELSNLARMRADAMSQIAADEEASAQDIVDAQMAINEQYYTDLVGLYEQQKSEALANLEDTSVVGFTVADIIKEYFDTKIAETQADLKGILAEITARGGRLPSVDDDSSGGGGGSSKTARSLERLKKLISDTELETARLNERLVNPFAYEIPRAIDTAREKVEKLAKDIGGQLTPEMERLVQSIQTNEVSKVMLDIAAQTRSIRQSLMGASAQRQAAHNEEVARLESMREKFSELGIWRIENEKIVLDHIAALQDQMEDATPFGQYKNKWKDLADDIGSFMADTFNGMSQELANFITDGEMDLASFARSILNTFLQININALLSGATNLLSGGSGGSGGGLFSLLSGIFHSGGVVGQEGGRGRAVSAAFFANAPRYHTGGIVGQEEPAILQRNEGVFTPNQMKALGGLARRSPDVTINHINNTGVPAEIEEQNVRFDGEEMIIDVVMRAASTPGRFRDTLKSAK